MADRECVVKVKLSGSINIIDSPSGCSLDHTAGAFNTTNPASGHVRTQEAKKTLVVLR